MGSGRGVTFWAAATLAARAHCAGPSAAKGRLRSPFLHHGAAEHSHAASTGSRVDFGGGGVPKHCDDGPPCVATTTGSYRSACARFQPLTS